MYATESVIEYPCPFLLETSKKLQKLKSALSEQVNFSVPTLG